MASVQKRISSNGETTFRVQVRTKGVTKSATFKRKTDAKRWAEDTEASIRSGHYFKTAEGSKHTLSEALNRYARKVLPNKKDSTRYSQQLQTKWWKDKIGNQRLSDISPALVNECIDHLEEKVKPATVNRYLALLSHVFTMCVKDWGWMNENPLAKVTRKKEPRGRVRYLSDDERVRLLDECRKSKNSCLYPAVLLGISTGMRQGEIINLRWEDVDLGAGRIVVQDSKNNERRAVPLVGLALQELKTYKGRHQRLDTTLVFPNRRLKRSVDLRPSWEQAIQRAGIEDFRFHDLRHTCASYLAMSNVSLAVIAEILGHKTLSMVKRYAHMSESYTSKVMEEMNAKIFYTETR